MDFKAFKSLLKYCWNDKDCKNFGETEKVMGLIVYYLFTLEFIVETKTKLSCYWSSPVRPLF